MKKPISIFTWTNGYLHPKFEGKEKALRNHLRRNRAFITLFILNAFNLSVSLVSIIAQIYANVFNLFQICNIYFKSSITDHTRENTQPIKVQPKNRFNKVIAVVCFFSLAIAMIEGRKYKPTDKMRINRIILVCFSFGKGNKYIYK